MAKAGRPKSNIETERIQYVIPKDILDELNKKVDPKSTDEDYKDRSRLITKAVKEMLGLEKKTKVEKKKRNFENIYSNIFKTDDLTLENELFKPFNSKDEDKKIKEIIKNFTYKIITEQSLTLEEINNFNEILKNKKFNIDEKLNVNCDSEDLEAFLFALNLNHFYPIKNYWGICKNCNRQFPKRRIKQNFCSNSCKLENFYKNKKGNKDKPQNTKQKNFKVIFSDYNNIEGGELQKWRKIINECYISSNEDYNEFKRFFTEKIWGNNNQKFRSISILRNELFKLLFKQNVKKIEKMTINSFLNWLIKELFPENCNKLIKKNTIKDLKKYLKPLHFIVEKNLFLATKKCNILKDNNSNNEILKAISEHRFYFKNQLRTDYKSIYSETDIEFQIVLNLQIDDLVTAIIKLNQNQIDDCINICNEILKNNPTCIDAHGLLIYAFIDKRNEKEIINHYYEIEKIDSYLNKSLNYNKEEILSLHYFVDYGYIKAFSSIAFYKNKESEKVLEILKQNNHFTNTETKKLRELILFHIYLDKKYFEQAKNALDNLKELGENVKNLEKNLEKAKIECELEKDS